MQHLCKQDSTLGLSHIISLKERAGTGWVARNLALQARGLEFGSSEPQWTAGEHRGPLKFQPEKEWVEDCQNNLASDCCISKLDWPWLRHTASKRKKKKRTRWMEDVWHQPEAYTHSCTHTCMHTYAEIVPVHIWIHTDTNMQTHTLEKKNK